MRPFVDTTLQPRPRIQDPLWMVALGLLCWAALIAVLLIALIAAGG